MVPSIRSSIRKLATARTLTIGASALLALLAGFLLLDPAGVWFARTLSPSATAFFRTITDVGRSYWMLYPSAVGIFYLLFLLRYGEWTLRQSAWLQEAAASLGYFFASVATAGIAVLIIKVIVGRARPKFFDALGPVAFEPFAFSGGFSSFPSGHSAQVFAAAMALGLLFPALRAAALACATFIAFSRIAISVHYVTDTIGGGFIGVYFALKWRDWFAQRGMLWRVLPDGAYRRRHLIPRPSTSTAHRGSIGE